MSAITGVRRRVQTPALEYGAGHIVVGRYVVRERIGLGPLGTVYRAEDLLAEEEVALRALWPELAPDDGTRLRFLRATTVARAVSNGFVAGVRDSFVDEAAGVQACVVVGDLLARPTLAERLARRQRYEAAFLPFEVSAMLSQLGSGLGAIHEAGLVHGSVSARNVFFAGEEVRIADLGAAVAVRPATLDDDVRALAAIAAEIVTAQGDHATPRARALVERALSHDDGDRFGSVDELVDAFLSALHPRGGRRLLRDNEATPPPITSAMPPLPRRSREVGAADAEDAEATPPPVRPPGYISVRLLPPVSVDPVEPEPEPEPTGAAGPVEASPGAAAAGAGADLDAQADAEEDRHVEPPAPEDIEAEMRPRPRLAEAAAPMPVPPTPPWPQPVPPALIAPLPPVPAAPRVRPPARVPMALVVGLVVAAGALVLTVAYRLIDAHAEEQAARARVDKARVLERLREEAARPPVEASAAPAAAEPTPAAEAVVAAPPATTAAAQPSVVRPAAKSWHLRKHRPRKRR